MTRKQAILLGISILEQNKKNEEIVSKLKEVASEYPYKHWSKTSVFDAIEQFRIEHNGRVPTYRDFKSKMLPSHSTIKHIFDMTINEFLNHYYPNREVVVSLKYNNHPPTYWLNDFKTTYLSINNGKHVTQQIYDQKRNKNSPCIQTLMKMLQLNTYQKLKELAGVDGGKLKIIVTHYEQTNCKK